MELVPASLVVDDDNDVGTAVCGVALGALPATPDAGLCRLPELFKLVELLLREGSGDPDPKVAPWVGLLGLREDSLASLASFSFSFLSGFLPVDCALLRVSLFLNPFIILEDQDVPECGGLVVFFFFLAAKRAHLKQFRGVGQQQVCDNNDRAVEG